MKRILAMLLVCLMCFALASCGEKNTDSTPDSATPDSSATGSASNGSTANGDAVNDKADDKSASSGSASSEPDKNDSAKSAPAVSDSADSDSSADAEEVIPTLKPDGEKYATIGEYLEDPKVKDSLDKVNESVDKDVITFSYYAEGGTLFYNYNYTKTYDEKNLEEMMKSHEKLLDDNADANEKVVSVLRTNTEITDPKLVVTYYNGDGAVIATRTYE